MIFLFDFIRNFIALFFVPTDEFRLDSMLIFYIFNCKCRIHKTQNDFKFDDFNRE